MKEDAKETILQSQTNFKINKKNEDIFNIGFLLIYCAIGGQSIINFSNYVCIHDYHCCCLYHCIEKYEEKLSTKLKISNFINKILFSNEFINFLCVTTNYNMQNNNPKGISKLKTHKFFGNVNNDNLHTLSQSRNSCLVSLADLIKITHEGSMSFNNKRNFYDKTNIKRFNAFCDTLFMLVQTTYDRYKIINKDIITEIKSKLIKDNKVIFELSKEFGVDVDNVKEKLDQIFSFEKYKSNNTID